MPSTTERFSQRQKKPDPGQALRRPLPAQLPVLEQMACRNEFRRTLRECLPSLFLFFSLADLPSCGGARFALADAHAAGGSDGAGMHSATDRQEGFGDVDAINAITHTSVLS